MQNHRVILLLGSDLGERSDFLNSAIMLLNKLLGEIIDKSSVYESEPWGFESDTKFLNQVVVAETKLNPEEILQTCQNIEKKLGRIRSDTGEYISRVIDIDILYIDDMIIEREELTVPHPKLQERRFTLVPLAEILPEFQHPVLKKNHKELLNECKDYSDVIVFRK